MASSSAARAVGGASTGVVAADKESMVNKNFILLSQVFMTFMMAVSMSGVMSLIHEGPSMDWLTAWPLQALMAWPIAFCLTMVAWPAAMKLAGATLRARGGGSAS